MVCDLSRRRAMTLGLGAAAGTALARPAVAQPQTPAVRGVARVIVGFAAGGSADTLARLLAERLRASGYAQTVIVENRVGAAGRLAVEALKGARPDGATILLTPSSMLVIFPHLYRRSLRYDPFEDLVAASPAGEFHFGMGVGPKAGMAANIADFLAWGRSQQDLPYGSAAAGSALHFLGVQFAKATGLPMTHVPYRGSAPAVQDLIAGQTAASFHPMVDLVPQHKGGLIRIAAVSSEQRLPRLPDVPTFAEQGYPQLTGSEWFGLFLPARTPPAIVEALHHGAAEASANPEYQEALARLELTPAPMTPVAFAARMRADYERWGPVVAESGFQPDE
jgi:tripartite-type tricarboxylate transporter receptor subunit TctC